MTSVPQVVNARVTLSAAAGFLSMSVYLCVCACVCLYVRMGGYMCDCMRVWVDGACVFAVVVFFCERRV